MVAVFVQTFGGTAPAGIVPRGSRAPGSEVVEQGPTAAVPLRRPKRTVQMLTIVEVPIHRPHEAIQHVACAVTPRMLVGNDPSVTLVAEVHDVVQKDTGETLRGPLPQRPNPLCERPSV